MPEGTFTVKNTAPRAVPPTVSDIDRIRRCIESRLSYEEQDFYNACFGVTIQGVSPWRTLGLSVSNDWTLYVDGAGPLDGSHEWPEGQTWVVVDEVGNAVPWGEIPGIGKEGR